MDYFEWSWILKTWIHLGYTTILRWTQFGLLLANDTQLLHGIHLFKGCLLFRAKVLEWDSTPYQFTCFPNGLPCCPRKFEKLMKPVSVMLRQKRHQSSPYLDDSFWLFWWVIHMWIVPQIDTTILTDDLRLVTHPEKSLFTPPHELDFLGFSLCKSDLLRRKL